MQDTKNIPIDTRTFAEIWAALGRSYERADLRDEIIRVIGASRQAVEAWGRGTRNPIYRQTRKRVCAIVNASLDIRTTDRTLFPNAHIS